MTKGRISILLVTFIAFVSVYGCDSKAQKIKESPKPVASVDAAAQNSSTNSSKDINKNDEKLPMDVVAKVGTWTLTVNELDERIKNIKVAMPDFDDKNVELKKMLVDELIRQQLMVIEARSQKLDQNKEVQAALKDFENNILVQELINGIVKDVSVTEEDAKVFYEKNPDMFINPVEKKVLEIILNTEAEAKDVLVLALQGGDFSLLAKDRSKAKSASKGGDLGFLTEAPTEIMQKVIDPLGKGAISAVFKDKEGYCIVKIDDVRGGDKLSYDKVKDELIKGLMAQKQQQAVLERLTEIANKNKVSVNMELFGGKTGE